MVVVFWFGLILAVAGILGMIGASTKENRRIALFCLMVVIAGALLAGVAGEIIGSQMDK